MADPYKVRFEWAKDGDHQGKLTAVSCEEENVPADETWQGRTLNFFAQASTGEREKACLAVNESNTLQIKKGRFLYMDVGCWLGGHQSFGLVCGEDAMVCEYTPGPSVGAPKSSGNALLDKFTRLPGVSVQFWEKIPSPHPADPKRLCLILPDMHVAEAPPPEYPRPPDDPQWNEIRGGRVGRRPARLRHVGEAGPLQLARLHSRYDQLPVHGPGPGVGRSDYAGAARGHV